MTEQHQQHPQQTAPALGLSEEPVLVLDGQSTGSSIIEPDSVLWSDGRTYHGFDEGAYLLPNDGPEQDRLDLQHALCTLLIDRRFGLAPFETAPRRVLDIATGTGIWALEFARQNPSSFVVGTDLSLIQPKSGVPNCDFLRENSETSEWIFPYFFDYIHCRYCLTCFNKTETVICKAFDYLRPGGYVEFFDFDGSAYFEGDTGQGSAWERWSQYLHDSLVMQGREPHKARHYREWIEQSGFVDVHEEIIDCPGYPWMEGEKWKQVGIFAREDCKAFMKGMHKIFAPVGLSAQEINELGQQCVEELYAEKLHFFFRFHVVYGRKPYEVEMTETQKTQWTMMQKKVAGL